MEVKQSEKRKYVQNTSLMNQSEKANMYKIQNTFYYMSLNLGPVMLRRGSNNITVPSAYKR